MAVDDVIVRAGPAAVPLDYTVPTGTEIVPRVISATLDGTSAASPFLAVLEVIAPNGTVTARCLKQVQVAAGASASVSWFPGGGVDDQAAADVDTSGGISSIDSPTGTITVTNPAGPTADVDLPLTGVAAGTYGDSLTVPRITVDAEGRATALTNVGIASGAGGGIVQVSKIVRTAGDVSTASTTFVDMTGLTTTITTGAHRCVVIFTGSGHLVGGNQRNGAVDLAIDGTRQGQAFGMVLNQQDGAGDSQNANYSFVFLTEPLLAGAHTFKMQFRSDSGLSTLTIFASAAVAPAILTVIELGV